MPDANLRHQSFRLPTELHRQLEAIAVRRGDSVSRIVREALRQYVKRAQRRRVDA
ncbi:MAG: ribbon-helix-helix protein, CopG family [Vicinamibacterales bacterium]